MDMKLETLASAGKRRLIEGEEAKLFLVLELPLSNEGLRGSFISENFLDSDYPTVP